MKKPLIIIIIFSISILNIMGQNLKQTYRDVVNRGISRTSLLTADTIRDKDLIHLPLLLQKYLNLTGVVGQERVRNVRIIFEGRMRSNPTDPWMSFSSEQYNFFDNNTRAFFIKAKKMGVPASGLHLYQNEEAFMKIKLAGLIKIIDVAGPEMDQSETVTFLNDICFFAPAVLVDLKNISWIELDSHRLEAKYTNGSQTISSQLVFNEEGWLINFISNDRYEIIGKEANQRPWYTPVEEYGEFGSYKLPKKAGTWYKRPDQEFCYGEFTTVDVYYNIQSVK